MTPRKITIIPIHQAGFAEPTLAEILADPITEAVMEADGVDASQLAIMLRGIAEAPRTRDQMAAPFFASKKCSRSGLSERRI
jgi:hypothetical protein